MTTCLALEFSSRRRAVAVARDGQLLAEAWVLGGEATSAPGLIGEALSRAGLRPADVGRLVVGIGPGSYTGIRRAIATAQGWHLALGTPVAPVGSLEILARIVQEPWGGEGWLATDAQRGEWACAETHEGGLRGPMRLLPKGELLAEIAAGRRVVTPDEGLEGARVLHPTAALAALLGPSLETSHPGMLEAVYLREASFVKAPAPRTVPGL